MAARKNLVADAPWRDKAAASTKPIPKIHHNPILRVPENPNSRYCILVMKNPSPVSNGLAREAILESAGPECIVPGQVTPVRILGLKVWPVDVSFKFLEPVGREMKSLGKIMNSAFNVMDNSHSGRWQ